MASEINWNNFIELVSEEEAETVDVVCMRDVPGEPRMPLAQNFGHCSRCLHPVYWANSAPKRPPRVCVECALELAEAEKKKKKDKR